MQAIDPPSEDFLPSEKRFLNYWRLEKETDGQARLLWSFCSLGPKRPGEADIPRGGFDWTVRAGEFGARIPCVRRMNSLFNLIPECLDVFHIAIHESN